MTEMFFEKTSRNMIVTEKMLKTIIIGNFIADNIVLGREQQAHHPEDMKYKKGVGRLVLEIRRIPHGSTSSQL